MPISPFSTGESTGFTTAQRLEAAWQTNYQFGKKAFVFGSVNGEEDRLQPEQFIKHADGRVIDRIKGESTSDAVGTAGDGLYAADHQHHQAHR